MLHSPHVSAPHTLQVPRHAAVSQNQERPLSCFGRQLHEDVAIGAEACSSMLLLSCASLQAGERGTHFAQEAQEVATDLEACSRSVLLIPLGCEGLFAPLQLLGHLPPLG